MPQNLATSQGSAPYQTNSISAGETRDDHHSRRGRLDRTEHHQACSVMRIGEKGWNMHVDYKNPWVQQLRDSQQAAPREQLLARIDAAERLIASVDVESALSLDAGARAPGSRRGSEDVRPSRKSPAATWSTICACWSRICPTPPSCPPTPWASRCSRSKSWPASSTFRPRPSRAGASLGLVSRRLVFDGRKRVGFLRSSVDRFVRNNADRVERGSPLQPAHRRAARRIHRPCPRASCQRRRAGARLPAGWPSAPAAAWRRSAPRSSSTTWKIRPRPSSPRSAAR